MILDTGSMRLLVVREVLKGKANDVVICMEEGKPAGSYYTVWVMKDHTMAKAVFRDFFHKNPENRGTQNAYLEYFSQGASFYFTFPYEQERPLMRFYKKEIYDLENRRRILLQMVAKCMTSGLPDTILYLILMQEQLQLGQDGEVRFQYMINFDDYPKKEVSVECVRLCAGIVYKLLGEEGKYGFAGQKLIEKKLARNIYFDMGVLYRDVRLVMDKKPNRSFMTKFSKLSQARERKIFSIVFFVCIILTCFTMFMMVSQIVWGEVPLFRIFNNSFEQIGTESLLR